MPMDLSPLPEPAGPSRLAALASRVRAALAPAEATDLLHRLDRWGPDLVTGLEVYPEPPVDRVLDLVLAAHRDRRPALVELDQRRLLRPDWFARPEQVGYVC